MVKVTTRAGAAVVVAGCGTWQTAQLAQLFVPSAPSAQVDAVPSVLRGAGRTGESASSASNIAPSATGVLAAGGASMLIASALSSRQRTERSSRRAETVAAPPRPPPFDPAAQVGVTAPMGFFDPLGFSKVGDEAGFRNLRSAERKHGRIAMMATLGAGFQHFFQLPGLQDGPKGLGAVTTTPGLVSMAVIFIGSGALETFVWKDSADKEPGDFGNPWSFKPAAMQDPVERGLRDRELNNGRFAMIGAAGIIMAELATGKDAVEQFF